MMMEVMNNTGYPTKAPVVDGVCCHPNKPYRTATLLGPRYSYAFSKAFKDASENADTVIVIGDKSNLHIQFSDSYGLWGDLYCRCVNRFEDLAQVILRSKSTSDANREGEG